MSTQKKEWYQSNWAAWSLRRLQYVFHRVRFQYRMNYSEAAAHWIKRGWASDSQDFEEAMQSLERGANQ